MVLLYLILQRLVDLIAIIMMLIHDSYRFFSFNRLIKRQREKKKKRKEIIIRSEFS
jgi:hypothetical protein